jgi:hypothetical protein
VHPYRVTTAKTPRPESGQPHSLATEWDRLSAGARTTRLVAIAALVLAIVALGLAAWKALAPAGTAATDDCQAQAWNTSPKLDDLPDGWTVGAAQYDLDRKNISFLGPVPADETSNQAIVYATVTCFDTGGQDAVTRSQKASEDAGQSVLARSDLGDQAYSAVDDSGSVFVHLRKGRIVAYLAGSDASTTEVDTIASAFDKALGGDGGTIAPPTTAPSLDPNATLDPNASIDPGASGAAESPAAPDLIALLPSTVGDVALATDSASGSTLLGEDQGSRAILASLRAAGKTADDMRVAQAYDETGVSDLSILIVTVDGMPVAQTRKLVLDSWLAATGDGVKTSDITLGGKPWTKIDYGDGGTFDYVHTDDTHVIVVTTADANVAEQTAAALK